MLRNSVECQNISIETMLGGVAVFDYNNDGLLDIFFTNGAAIPSLQKTDPTYGIVYTGTMATGRSPM